MRLGPKPNQDYCKSKKENSSLKQQLTRDSGIDSDNTHHQPLPKITGFKRPQQIFLTNKMNNKHSVNNEMNQTNAETTYKTVTSPMSKGPRSLTIKINTSQSLENDEFIENTSPRYNNTDEDYQIHNKSVSIENNFQKIDKTAKISDESGANINLFKNNLLEINNDEEGESLSNPFKDMANDEIVETLHDINDNHDDVESEFKELFFSDEEFQISKNFDDQNHFNYAKNKRKLFKSNYNFVLISLFCSLRIYLFFKT